MKLYLSILLIVFCVGASAQVVPDALGFFHPKIIPTHNVHYIDNTSQFPSFYNGHGVDTFVVRIAVINGGIDFGQDTGITVINGVDQVVINGGIRWANIQDCNLIGWGSDSTYGFKMVGGGVGGTFDGMQHNNKIEGCQFTGASQGGVWWKQDPAQICIFPAYYNQFAPNGSNPNPAKYVYADPYQYLNKPYDSCWFIHNKIDHCGGEGMYFMTTDYILSNGTWRDAIPCLNNQRLAPTQARNCRFDSNEVFTTGRTGIQGNQFTAGINSISYNYIHNTGYEYAVTHDPSALSQGAAVRVGWEWNQQAGKQMNVIGNYGDTCFLYFLDIEEAANVQFNNFGVHFGQVYYNGSITTNPQPNPGAIFYANNPAVNIQQICNNIVLGSTASGGTKFAVYLGANYLSSGNHANGNNEAVTFFAGSGSNFDTKCGTSDTTYKDTTVRVIHDSLVLGHFDSVFAFKDTTIISLMFVDTSFKKSKRFVVRFHYNAPKDTTIRYLVRAAFDSAFICSLCANHDSTYKIPIFPKLNYGVFILDGYNGITTTAQKLHYTKQPLGFKYLRENYTAGNTYQNKQYLDSAITPLMTYNTADVQSGPHPIPTNIPAMTKTADSLFSISKPFLASFLNEPPTIQYWDSTGGGVVAANKYITALNAFVSVCSAHGILSADGGMTSTLVYRLANYYQSRGLTDSLTWLENVTGIGSNQFFNSTNGIYWNNWYATFLPAERSSNVNYARLDYYAPQRMNPTDSTTDNGLLSVLINFIVNQTGKKVITLETGIGNGSQILFNDMFTEWSKYKPDYLLYFLGSGSNSVPNESFFLTFSAQNP